MTIDPFSNRSVIAGSRLIFGRLAIQLAERVGGRVCAAEYLHEVLPEADVVIASSGAPHYVLHGEGVRHRNARDTWLGISIGFLSGAGTMAMCANPVGAGVYLAASACYALFAADRAGKMKQAFDLR